MTSEVRGIEAAGDPRHPDHDAFLAELGGATYASLCVAGISFDILRVFDHVPSPQMYNDPLGALLKRLRGLSARQPGLLGLGEFIETLEAALETRNDLLHALPVQNGLHRRTSKDLSRVRNFFTVEDLRAATLELQRAHRAGSTLLYHDGGTAVQAWYEAGGG